MTRRWVFRRRLPAAFGSLPLFVNPGAALAYLLPLHRSNWRDVQDFAAKLVHPRHRVWDIGANLGVFAFCAAHRAGPAGEVLAVEADPWLAHLVQRSATLPGDRAPVDVLCAAIAGKVGLQSFLITARTRSGSHLNSATGASVSVVGPTSERFPVVTLTLDQLCEWRLPPDVLKIDVEGAELEVLQGASNLLRRTAPRILIETYEAHADTVTEILRDAGYDLFDFTAGWEGRRRIDRATYQTLALPRDSGR